MKIEQILLVVIIVLAFILIITLIYKFIKSDIRYNFKSRHFGVVKKHDKKKKIIVVVEMSSKPFSRGQENIPMKKNTKKGSKSKTYFIKKVRSRKESTFGKRLSNRRLTFRDIIVSDKIYKKHLNAKKEIHTPKGDSN